MAKMAESLHETMQELKKLKERVDIIDDDVNDSRRQHSKQFLRFHGLGIWNLAHDQPTAFFSLRKIIKLGF